MRISDWSSDVCSSDLMKIDSLLPGTQQAKRLRRYQMLAQWRLRRGISMLSQARVIVPDRLPAHILSLLLDIPPVVFANMNGKASAFAARPKAPTSDPPSHLRTSFPVFCLQIKHPKKELFTTEQE